jgi:demethylmenaquinone methyltransferase/2-methoxy-6-polyprenyl-1,4-benzoquinol methylase
MRKDVPTANAACPSSVGPMFDRIAPTYDLLNHLLSLGRDYSWRRKVTGQLRGKEAPQIIDLATGTGDLLISLLRACPTILKATGLDISDRMLAICREKLQTRGLAERADLVRADASATPFSGGTFDVVTMAFGIRNTANAATTLKEIHRILKSRGTALILEFSLPANRAVRWCYLKYLRSVVPRIGAAVSGDGHAYRYLDESIEGFYRPEAFSTLMRQTGFQDVSVIPLTFGVASIYRGIKGSVSE